MKQHFLINTLIFLILTSVFTIASACAQSDASVDNSETRKEKIKANLFFLFPQLDGHQVQMGDFEDIDMPGMTMGRFVVDGQQQQPFLINDDDTALYLLAGGPFDVSKTEEDLADEIASRKEAERAKAMEVNDALKPAVADMPYRGSADAPVLIVEFSDFQCPYCARATDTMHRLIGKYAEDVKLVYVQFPLESIHPWARAASIASICAANQSNDAFWTLHDKYFEDQGTLDTDNIIDRSQQYLGEADIDMDQWKACATDEGSDAYQAASTLVDTSLELGQSYGVRSTPAFFINGHLINGAQPLETFEAAVKDALD